MPLQDDHKRLLSLCQTGRFAKAIKLAQKLVKAHPKQPALWHVLACARVELGQLEAALPAFRNTLKLNPSDAGVHYNYACALQKLFNLELAAEHFNKALTLKPDYAQAANNLGNVLRDLGQNEDALRAHERAVSLDPDWIDAQFNLATSLRLVKQLDRAIAICQQILDAQPEHMHARSLLLRLKAEICDFSAYSEFEQFREALDAAAPAPPFQMLAFEDDPARQLQRSKRWTQATYPTVRPSLRPAKPREKIKIGYFSANFCEHPEVHLISGLLRCHDQSRFEVHAYSTRAQIPNEHITRVKETVAGCHDVHALPDEIIAKQARTDGLDIAIDLNGHLQASRLGIFAHRAAPLQVTYLGYSGSSGAEFFDYMVADQTVIPPEHRAQYSEKIIYMPASFMPTDNLDPVDTCSLSRQDVGLPDDAIVMCCFNNSYKIGPREFDIWMRVMAETANCVLWLRGWNPWMEGNLRREAEQRGVDGSRIIFADRAERALHLARHQLADIFVDTFTYTAHSTGVDALWAGLPIVTKLGDQFSARVGASLVSSIGMPELIGSDEAEYETILHRFVRDADWRADLTSRLSENRSCSSLFDTAGYTRAFEAALASSFQRAVLGNGPVDLPSEKDPGKAV